MKRTPLLVAGALALVAAAGAFLGWGVLRPAPQAAPPPDPAAEFLARHWADPIPAQGEPPAAYSALEAALDPESCGKCHPRQFLDWKTSLHGASMGPGILWQFHVMEQKAANRCMRCHAPLAEQKALLAMERRWENAPTREPPGYIAPDLHRQGLICAACHVRQHARAGPPARSGANAASAALPHGGFSANAAFEDSRFCAVCHQFPADGARLNGKLIENTFEEWRASEAARQGRTCQSCHMPDRRHLWRGIHDPEMTRQALSVSLDVRPQGKGILWAQAELVNTGAGHHFPTYLVPEVVATLERVDARGAARTLLARHVIGRQANLELTHEIADTRIAAGERVRLGGEFPWTDTKGGAVELRVMVYPGKHYERLFRSELERRRDLSAEAARLLREALAHLEGSGYELYRVSRPLPSTPPAAR